MKIKMTWPSGLAFLLTLFFALPSAAKNEPRCAPELASTERYIALTPDQAEEVVGQMPLGIAGPQVERALMYILAQKQASFDEKIEDLRLLMEAIRRLQLFIWRADKFYGPGQSAGFVGDQGFFILLRRDGKLFKGRMRIERDLNEHFEWNGGYDSIKEVLAK